VESSSQTEAARRLARSSIARTLDYESTFGTGVCSLSGSTVTRREVFLE